MTSPNKHIAQQQIKDCILLLQQVLSSNLLGVYLYGSSVVGGLQRYSDIDLFVILNRPTTHDEKEKLVSSFLKISGLYMRSEELPIEITFVVQSEINPWRYPPRFDFQYGEWMREQFESGNIEPWDSKEMPDLALLITQVLLASSTLVGPEPAHLIGNVPYNDFMKAIIESLPQLMLEVESDTRNVLLTLVRIWNTIETDRILSKPDSARWAIEERLPEHYKPVITRARDICIGDHIEHWDDMLPLIKDCADFILHHINIKIANIMSKQNLKKSIKL